MSDESQQPIVVKRIRKGGGGAHGGAWKIAYADFVTAMMAFFLLMWLIGSTARGDLEGIAEYFQTPLKVALQGGVGSGDASHVIKGGGKDLTRTDGQVKKGETEAPKKTVNLEALKAEQEKVERRRLEDLKLRIEQMIEANPRLSQYRKQLLLDLTSEGLRIQIVDEKNRPMFDLSSAELKPYTKEILHEIGRALNGVENRISLSGHTDAAPYAGGEKGFGNWELSASRANASRRALVEGGMGDAKLMRVVGLSSTALFNKSDPLDPVNRRISIVVLNKRTEEAFLREGMGTEDGGAQAAGSAAVSAGGQAARVPVPPQSRK
ncbi:MAG: flagellar motor protein MotB [Rhodocyclaceae bacterium]